MKVEHFSEVRARVIVWELSGNENHRMFLQVLLRNLDAILFVFSLSSPQSFESAIKLVNELTTEEGPVAYLIGTHSDLPREVTTEEVKSSVDKHKKIVYLESPGNSGVSVLSQVAQLVVTALKKLDDESKKKDADKGQSRWCCFGKAIKSEEPPRSWWRCFRS